MPLFDCLSLNPVSSLDLEGLKESIAREIEHILNTRPAAKNWSFSSEEESIQRSLPHYFGLRDFALQEATSPLGQRHIMQEIIKVINQYEPRLKNVKVRLNFEETNKQAVMIEISGDIRYGDLKINTTFPITAHNLIASRDDSRQNI